MSNAVEIQKKQIEIVNFDGFSRMNSGKIKLKHYIATHTFHSSNGMKEFKNAFKHRKKSSDWFDTETPDVKKHFFQQFM